MDADSRKDYAPRGRRNTGPREAKKPLRVEVAEIDQEILRLLMRRFNLLAKMKAHGRLEPADEKFIREAWQKDVAKISRDPDLSGAMFTLMQQFSFLPRPSAAEAESESAHKTAFNLAPPDKPVKFFFKAPLSSFCCCAWLYMAAAAGAPLRLDPCLQNDPELDFIKALVQLGGSVSRDDTAIVARSGDMLGRPDRVVYVGDNEFGFYLVLAHYLGQPARAKFTGATSLKMADFSAVRHFLPLLHARLVNLLPKSDGLPARLESAGLLPPGIAAPADLPAAFIEALILAAPFYPAPFALDLSLHPGREAILAHAMPILSACAVTFSLSGASIIIEPSSPVMPQSPQLPMDAELAAFLLAFIPALTGEAKLQGVWPDWPQSRRVLEIGRQIGWKTADGYIEAQAAAPLSKFHCNAECGLPAWTIPWQCALAACAVLRGGNGRISPHWLEDADLQDFLRVCGLKSTDDGMLSIGEAYSGPDWNAPTAPWAMALAVAACARTGKRGWHLGNPASVMALWPAFWVFYNSLPEPKTKKFEVSPDDKPKTRRRILTSAMAVIPEPKEVD